MKAPHCFQHLTTHLVTVVRWGLAVVFVWAGAAKVLEPMEFARAIHRYQLLPDAAVNPLAIILPWLEIVIGACLVVSIRFREAAATLALGLMVVFMGALAISWARGLNIDCGCFGTGATTGGVALALGRDIALTAMAFFVVWHSGLDGPTPDQVARMTPPLRNIDGPPMRHLLAPLVAALAGLPGQLPAAELLPEGNWNVTWTNEPEDGQEMPLRITLRRNYQAVWEPVEGGGHRIFSRLVENSAYSLSGHWGQNFDKSFGGSVAITADGTVNIKWNYFVHGHWGGSSELRMIDAGRMIGRWWYGDQRQGQETWQRMEAKVTHAVFRSEIESTGYAGSEPGRVEKTFDAYWWGPSVDMRGNRPRFRIDVYGESMWGIHVLDLGGAVDLEPIGHRYIWSDGTRTTGDYNPESVIGIAIEVVVWAHFRPGRKVVRIDGQPIEYDFVVKGYPGESRDEVPVPPRQEKWTSGRVACGCNREPEVSADDLPTRA